MAKQNKSVVIPKLQLGMLQRGGNIVVPSQGHVIKVSASSKQKQQQPVSSAKKEVP